MTVRYVLDTDILSDLQRSHTRVVEKVRGTDARLIATTIITAFEQLHGRFSQIDGARTPEQIVQAYRRLHEAIVFFREVLLLDYTPDAEKCYSDLRTHGVTPQKVKTLDLRIGCIALSIGATLVTRNRGHFQAIPRLLTEDWSA